MFMIDSLAIHTQMELSISRSLFGVFLELYIYLYITAYNIYILRHIIYNIFILRHIIYILYIYILRHFGLLCLYSLAASLPLSVCCSTYTCIYISVEATNVICFYETRSYTRTLTSHDNFI